MTNKLKKDFKDKSMKNYEKEIAKLKKQLKKSNELLLLSNARYKILEVHSFLHNGDDHQHDENEQEGLN